ncbi:MAG: prepilin peptidase [Gordonia polyisoprenivorans]|nr:prepilin peptidase [Gordonia polyisoprenivorans]
MNPIALAGPFAALLGVSIGSFLNVVAYRVPAGLSVVRPASACPGCGHAIAGRDNIPVLSWLMLRGRCRECRMRISARYPAIEILTGLAFLAVTLVVVPEMLTAPDAASAVATGIRLVALLYLAAISIALAAIDIDVHRLPDRIVLPSIVVALVLLGASCLVENDAAAALRMVIGGAASFVFYFALAFAKPGGMGLGDVKLAGLLGLYLGCLGWAQLAVGVLAAFVLGGIVGIVLLATRRVRRGGGIPFGPWMLAGAWLGIFIGVPLAGAYLSLVGIA